MQRIRIVNATIYTPDPTDAREVTIVGRRIARVGESVGDPPADVVFDAGGAVLTPGLVDALVHGGGGKSTMSGDAADLRAVAEAHGRQGTTTLCCGTNAAPMDTLKKALRAIGEATRNGTESGAQVLGAYVEGKFGAPEKKGAHAEEHLEPPTVEAFQALWAASGGALRVLSYAPERDEGLALTRYLSERRDELGGVVPTMGHTNATYDEARRAVDAGIRRATHTFNGMSGLHHRELGAAEVVLEDPRVHAELIGDGRHVHPTWARLLMRLRTAAGVGLITDAGAPAGLESDTFDAYWAADPSSAARVARESRDLWLIGDSLYLDAQGQQLTGTAMALRSILANAIRWGASVAEAVRMASTSPAENLGLTQKGRIAPGHDADLVVFDGEWRPRAVFVEGRAIHNDLPNLPA
jgi:N-acetylglucosamine-6-phosphate deacetylase